MPWDILTASPFICVRNLSYLLNIDYSLIGAMSLYDLLEFSIELSSGLTEFYFVAKGETFETGL